MNEFQEYAEEQLEMKVQADANNAWRESYKGYRQVLKSS